MRTKEQLFLETLKYRQESLEREICDMEEYYIRARKILVNNHTQEALNHFKSMGFLEVTEHETGIAWLICVEEQ